MEKLLKNKSFLILFALIVPALVFFHRLGENPLGGDDCYYSQVAKEMAAAGDYLSPRNGGKVDFHTSKPPMLYWMNAFSGNIFGFNSFAMRLPSAILGFLGVAAVFLFTARYFGIQTGFLAALILTFTQQYLYHARSAVTDGPFAVFFALSLLSFWAARSENKAVFYYLWGLFLGMAVMTRQLPGFFILPAVLAYIIFTREYRILKNLHFYGALFLSVVVILPWHAAMYAKYGDWFIGQYLGVTLKTGITGYPAGYSSSASLNPWYAYYEILLSNYQPWLIFLLTGLYKIARYFGSYDGEERKKFIFLLSWSFVTLAIFQAAKVKQYHYIMPIYAPFAVISAWAVSGFGQKARKIVITTVAALAAALGVLYIFFPIVPQTLDSREYVENLKLVPALRELPGDLHVTSHGSSYFNNCFRFYADKNVVPHGPEEFAGLINAPEKRIFAALKDDMPEIEKLLSKPVKVIMESKDSVLFSN